METFKEWLLSHQKELDELLRDYKAVYFRGFPVACVEDFDEVVRTGRLIVSICSTHLFSEYLSLLRNTLQVVIVRVSYHLLTIGLY